MSAVGAKRILPLDQPPAHADYGVADGDRHQPYGRDRGNNCERGCAASTVSQASANPSDRLPASPRKIAARLRHGERRLNTRKAAMQPNNPSDSASVRVFAKPRSSGRSKTPR